MIASSEPETGSWFQYFAAQLRNPFSKTNYESAFAVERALQMQTMQVPQADADKKLLEGIATFLIRRWRNDAVLQWIGTTCEGKTKRVEPASYPRRSRNLNGSPRNESNL